MDEEEAASLHALQYLNSHMVSMVLQAAVELDVFGIIARSGPGAHLTAREIASQMKTSSQPDRPGLRSGGLLGPRLDGILRLLVTHAFLRCSLRSVEGGKKERAYGIAPPAMFFMGSPDQGSLAPRLQLSHLPVSMDTYSSVKEAILGGGNQFEKSYGVSVYQFLGTDKRSNKTFNDSMVAISTVAMSKILAVYKGFEGLNSLLDVGGGSGKITCMIVSKYTSINCINFDLPHVIKTAPSYPGVEHVEGDMCVNVPKADSILMKDILHNWGDKHCVKLLKNCYEALPEKRKIIIITRKQNILSDSNLSPRHVAEIDFIMQLMFTDYERNVKELEALCMASGFSSVRVVCSAYAIWDVVEVAK